MNLDNDFIDYDVLDDPGFDAWDAGYYEDYEPSPYDGTYSEE